MKSNMHENHMKTTTKMHFVYLCVWPPQESVPIRVIQVPTKIHMSMPHHKAHPIFEHTAENVAFRRARGKFILKTNIDNILSPDTVSCWPTGNMVYTDVCSVYI